MASRNGSSPLARGTHQIVGIARGQARFIPARAGNTPPSRSAWPRGTVHPRSRGEHEPGDLDVQVVAGSSPLARGTRGRLYRDGARVRFIPARAGNTPAMRTWYRRRPVHPRSRGEHMLVIPGETMTDGSSPLARGTPAAPDSRRAAPRFIPARAGNTDMRRLAFRSRAVHPRSRGEHLVVVSELTRRDGSSPLARGTLTGGDDWPRRGRFIPARAGNTCDP